MKQPGNQDGGHLARLRLVARIWNWLPAFRAVAETNHLPTAAERLHVSPSALSRTIKLLEEAVGSPLFDRVGRGIELNARGQALLMATRDATRRVHAGLETMLAATDSGRVCIATGGAWSLVYLAPMLQQLARQYPDLEPDVVPVRPSTVVADLAQGAVDVAILSVDVRAPSIDTTLLATVQNAVFCGAGHPLHGRTDVELAELQQHAFVAPPLREGIPVEGWPAGRPRVVKWKASRMQEGVSVAQTGLALSVLPVPVGEAAGLWPLPMPELASVPIYALTRSSLGDRERSDFVVEVARAVLL